MIDRHLLDLDELRRRHRRRRCPGSAQSRVSVTSLQPRAPPASLMSRNAISTDFGAGLAVFAGRAGQFHDHADGDGAVRGPGELRPLRPPRRWRRPLRLGSSCYPPIRQCWSGRSLPACLARAASGGRRVEIVLHDRAVPARPVALEIEHVAVELPGIGERGIDGGPVALTEVRGSIPASWQRDGPGCGRPRSPRDARTIEHPAARDSGDVGPVAGGHTGEDAEQMLEQLPAAEIVDDQLVLAQRAVLERLVRAPARRASARRGSRRRPCRSRGARCRAGGTPRPSPSAGGRRAANTAAACVASGTPAATSASTWAVSKLVAPMSVDLAVAAQLVEPARGLDAPRHRIVPPMELHEVEPLACRAAAATGRRRRGRGRG